MEIGHMVEEIRLSNLNSFFGSTTQSSNIPQFDWKCKNFIIKLNLTTDSLGKIRGRGRARGSVQTYSRDAAKLNSERKDRQKESIKFSINQISPYLPLLDCGFGREHESDVYINSDNRDQLHTVLIRSRTKAVTIEMALRNNNAPQSSFRIRCTENKAFVVSVYFFSKFEFLKFTFRNPGVIDKTDKMWKFNSCPFLTCHWIMRGCGSLEFLNSTRQDYTKWIVEANIQNVQPII